jgi:toxin secretion/phage lysis holin
LSCQKKNFALDLKIEQVFGILYGILYKSHAMSSLSGYLQYLFAKVVSSSLFKGILGLLGLTADYVWQLPLISKLLPVLLLFILDMILGTVAALKHKKFSWKRFFSGLIKLGMYTLFLLVCSIVDSLFHWTVFSDLSLGFVIGTEFLSILKNMSKLGSKFPSFLTKKLKELIALEFKIETMASKPQNTVDKKPTI